MRPIDCHSTVLGRNGKAPGRMYAHTLRMVPSKVDDCRSGRWYPTSREKRARYPEFPARPGTRSRVHLSLRKGAHAFTELTKLHRKSEIWPTRSLVAGMDSDRVSAEGAHGGARGGRPPWPLTAGRLERAVIG